MSEADPFRTVDEIEGAPRRTGRFWFDFIAASAAIFISVVSLVIGMRGETIQKDLLAANSWPFLELDEERSSAISISIKNEGVGPAKVESFEVFYKDQPVDSSLDLLRRCCGLSQDNTTAREQLSHDISLGDVADNVIRPDESRQMIRMGRPASDSSLFDSFDAQFGSFTFRVCYCSILDKCWMSNLQTLKPAEVASCPVPTHPFKMIDTVFRVVRDKGK